MAQDNATTAGHSHPISQAITEINAIFYDMGFSFAEGPLIETQWYNFDALNVPRDHPARDMQDTFFVQTRIGRGDDAEGTRNSNAEGLVLRTHTSPVQVRYMEAHEPPLRVIVPGRAFRNEATDATHEAQFYQLEGLAIDTDITLGHLKGTLEEFFSRYFGRDIKTRFRPGYFPFVEPGVEVDMYYTSARGEKWIELLGAGMVHPNVLKAAGIDPDTYQGFAFGVGIERLLAIRHEIDDIRMFHQGDLRFVNQF